MVRHVYGERVTFHSGDGEIAPGVTVHRVGGHSDGLQVVRVETARGPVVLASDAAHYYANLQKRSPFPIVYNVGDMAQGWEIVERLAGHPDRFIPGHDPIVSEIYPRASDKVDAFALASGAVAFVREVGPQTRCQTTRPIGFIGLGVMGEPICRNLVKKSGKRVMAFDLAPEPLARLRAEGAEIAGSVADVDEAKRSVVSVPAQRKTCARGVRGRGHPEERPKRPGRRRSRTSSVSQTRDFAKQLQAKGASWADAPIARTRQAAQDGTLSVMVGAFPRSTPRSSR